MLRTIRTQPSHSVLVKAAVVLSTLGCPVNIAMGTNVKRRVCRQVGTVHIHLLTLTTTEWEYAYIFVGGRNEICLFVRLVVVRHTMAILEEQSVGMPCPVMCWLGWISYLSSNRRHLRSLNDCKITIRVNTGLPVYKKHTKALNDTYSISKRCSQYTIANMHMHMQLQLQRHQQPHCQLTNQHPTTKRRTNVGIPHVALLPREWFQRVASQEAQHFFVGDVSVFA